MGKRKPAATLPDTQSESSAKQHLESAEIETGGAQTFTAFDTPEIQREIANFVKLIGCIRADYRTAHPQSLDNESGER